MYKYKEIVPGIGVSQEERDTLPLMEESGGGIAMVMGRKMVGNKEESEEGVCVFQGP